LLLLLLSALGILGIWALANRVVRFSAREQPDRSPAISQNSPSAGNTPATSPSPGTSPNRTAASPEATTVPSTSALLGAQPLTKEVAKAVVTTWLTVKADAMGDNHNIEKLSTILTEPVLSQWQLQAQDAQTNNVYGRYTHEVLSIGELEISDDEPNQAAIVTEVREAVQFYQDGQVDPGSSYDRTLRVRYTLIHQDEQWRIQAISVLE
jgi:cytoskeletal protein RodZ